MAIQIPNVGTGVPADQTGDSPWLAMTKVADNFSNTTHAASKIVGSDTGQIPLAENVFKAAFSRSDTYPAAITDANQLEAGTRVLVRLSDVANTSPFATSGSVQFLETIAFSGTAKLQIAYNYVSGQTSSRMFDQTWKAWLPTTTHAATYSTTTAQGANTVVGTNGQLMRSTSSERYKEILSNVVLDDETYNRAINEIQPIVYRSTADADNAKYHYYSFSAEKVGAFDPALALWRETETVTDDEGNTTEHKLDERQAEGLNINGLLALQYAMITYQHNKQADLESRILKIEQANED